MKIRWGTSTPETLKFIAVSGTTKVTQNMYVYEYKNEIIIVDCGVGFPEEVAFGVDLVIPDFSYVLKNKHKVKGILISHGHEDHYGALPFLFKELWAPIYTAALTAEFIRDKFEEYHIKKYDIQVINPLTPQTLNIGNFKVDSFRVTHSVPDSLGFCIKTPIGGFFHVSDYKFDWTPVDGKLFDIGSAASLARDGVLCMASDSLGATSEGYTASELEIERTIDFIMQNSPGRVFFTTISSNISRMQQAINVAVRQNRKVVLLGRSIEEKMEIARNLEYLNSNIRVIVTPKEAKRLAPNRVVYIVSGSYGQVGSALYRIAIGEHDFLKIRAGDVVVFSSDPNPPGTEQTVNFVVDNLIEAGAEVHYYDTQENLHVSGHGSQKDIEMLMALVRPKYLIPIGGTVRHMRAYKSLAKNMHWPEGDVFDLTEGQVVEFTPGGAKRGETIPVREVLVDGLGVGDVGHMVLRDRKTLAQEGIVIVVVQLDKQKGRLIDKPDIISRGFVFAREQKFLINQAAQIVTQSIAKREKPGNGHFAREIIVETLERFFFDKTGRRPMILPVVVEV